MAEKKKAAIRKVLTVVMTENVLDSEGATTYHGSLIAVCDDGAVFSYYWPEGEWSEMPPVPGTARESIKTKADAKEDAAARKKFEAEWRALEKRRPDLLRRQPLNE